TDLRETEVQQPKTLATLSWVINWRAFSAKSGQFDAGSTTTGSIGRPITPPFALISSKVIRAVFLSAVSEIAMVPESECSTPTLIGDLSCANRMLDGVRPGKAAAVPAANFRMERRDVMEVSSSRAGSERTRAGRRGRLVATAPAGRTEVSQ